MNVCGEIAYNCRTIGGERHSDICIVHDGEYKVDPDLRKFLHQCLDEWIDRSKGTGMFWVGDPQWFVEQGASVDSSNRSGGQA